MNSPIEKNILKHYIVVNGIDYEIVEPVGFDGATFVVEQEGNRHGRDVFYIDQNTKFRFKKDDVNSGFAILYNEWLLKGSEANVQYKILNLGVEVVGSFDYTNAVTDEATFIELSVIQNTNQSVIKKRINQKVDLLASKDLDDAEIEPLQLEKILLKAKPIRVKSEWDSRDAFIYAQAVDSFDSDGHVCVFSFATNLKSYELQNALVPFVTQTNYTNLSNDIIENFVIYKNKNQVKDVQFSLKGKVKLKRHVANQNYNFGIKLLKMPAGGDYYEYLFNNTPDIFGEDNIAQNSPLVADGFHKIYDLDLNIDLTTYNLQISDELLLVYYISGSGEQSVKINVYQEDLITTLTATEYYPDSVIYGTRFFDAIKQNIKALKQDFSVIAPDYSNGGKHYNNFVFSGNLIRQKIDKPFYFELKDVIEQLKELNFDYEIRGNEFHILPYNEFYKNVQIAEFLQVPDTNYRVTKNEFYLINKFSYGYKKYEQDDKEKGTIDAINTDSEWFIPSENSINELSISLPFIRDTFSLEKTRRQAITEKETSQTTDDDVYIVSGIPLAPNTYRTYTFELQHLLNGSVLKLLNDGSFNWGLLGFVVGNNFEILNGLNVGNYTVTTITNNILTLTSVGSIGNAGSNSSVTSIKYPITNVAWQVESSEQLIGSENISNPEIFLNLRYSIKRNILEGWLPYLAGATQFIDGSKSIKNTYFKANGTAKTKFIGETEFITENENISIAELKSKIIVTQNIVEVTVVADFNKMVQLLADIQNIRGFVKINNSKKGFVKKINYKFATNELQLILLEANV